MLQMYKVFVNDKPIFVTDVERPEKNSLFFDFSDFDINKVLSELDKPEVKVVQIISKNLKNDWELFQKEFKVIEAAGGKVLNNCSETLFIYRHGKWDLPKGHIEKGEQKEMAAIREVEEECGISNLVIDSELETTFHVFYNPRGERCLKVTYWYLMHTSFTGDLKPQKEEGISRVQFFNSKELNPILKNTYENIKLLFS
jgi:ADP-ribose pyrophosphatase YjhB (NUDIX family)